MTKTRSRVLRWLVGLPVLSLGLWSAYWFAGAFAIQQATALASDEARRVGVTAAFVKAPVTGYPTRFAISLADLTVSRDSLIWQTQAVQVDAESHRPFDIALDLSEPHRIAGRFGGLEIDTSEARVTVLFRPQWDLPLGEIVLDATDVVIGSQAQWRIDMTQVRSELRQDTVSEATYRVTAAIDNVALDGLFADLPPEYRFVPELRLDGILDFDRAWDRSLVQGHTPFLEELALSRAAFRLGSSTIIVQAHLTRDQSTAVSGTATVTVEGWRTLFDQALERGYLDPQLASFFLPMLTALASQQAPETELTLPLRIQDGTVFFGAVALGVLPAIP